jgi:hypothetical protein
MDIGVVRIWVAKLFPDLPMPIGEKTVSESKKDPQYKPGKCCNPQGNEIPFSKGFEYPTKEVKGDQ